MDWCSQCSAPLGELKKAHRRRSPKTALCRSCTARRATEARLERAALERSVEDYFIARVAATGGEVRKVAWLGRRGAPDRLAGWPNKRHGLVELKRPRGSAQAHQAREHIRLRAIGFRVDVIDTRALVDAYVEEMSRGC